MMLDLYTYTYKDGVPIQPVSASCELAVLDCDTLSTVFAAALRANNVPARVCFAWPARTIKPDAKGMISGHAQAEFFLARAGWVPADLAYGLTAKASRKDVMRYFGEDNGNLLVAQVDPDYVVRNPAGTQRIDSMHPGPNCWSCGTKRPDVRYRSQIWEVETKLEIQPATTEGQ